MNIAIRRIQRGFSLTELMVVMIIVGVLAAIGMPAYRDYAMRAKRSDATQALSHMAALQERFFSDNNSYAANATALGYGSNTPASNEGYWQLSVQSGTAAAFELRATNLAPHVDPECTTFSVTSAGVQGLVAGTSTAEACWGGR